MPFTTEQRFIIRAEEALGRRLPAAYVTRMLRSNGGSVEVDDEIWVMHPVRDDSDRKRLARTCNDVVCETISAREWKTFPESAVAIGTNGSGDLLVLIADSAEQFGGAVYVWEHETGETRQVAPSVAALTEAGQWAAAGEERRGEVGMTRGCGERRSRLSARTPKDLRAAFRWNQRAARLGYHDAQRAAGGSNTRVWCRRDLAKARWWYEPAARARGRVPVARQYQ